MLALLVLVTIAFAREWLPIDVVTLLMLLVLVGSGILTPAEAFAGYGSEIIIILASVFVISGALRDTGIVDRLSAFLLEHTSQAGERRLLMAVMAPVAALSAFMNNTTVTALMIAPVTALAGRKEISPSKLLMPLAFASILGGTCTLIGTSTNVAVSGYLTRVGERGIGFFELTPIGLILVATGIVGMVFIGRRLLPDHPNLQSLTENYGLAEYLSEVVIEEGSPLIGRTLRGSGLGELDLRVLNVLREGKKLSARPATVLHEGDVLLVNGAVQSLMKVRETEGIAIRPDVKFMDVSLKEDDMEMLEVLVTPLSGMRDRTIGTLDLPTRLGITILAVNRHGRHLCAKLKSVRLHTGDLLLARGPKESMASLLESPDFAIFGEPNLIGHPGKKGLIVVGAVAVGIGASAAGWIPISVGLLGAALASVIARAIPVHRIYNLIEWRLLVLIGGMIAMGIAMEKTHAAELLAGGIVSALEPAGPIAVLAAFVLLTALLTQPMSNAAAALVILPVALSAAAKLGVDGRAFAMAITYAASVSLIAPFEPSSLLVFGPGKYRIVDFLKVGGFLTLVLLALVVLLVPLQWPLKN